MSHTDVTENSIQDFLDQLKKLDNPSPITIELGICMESMRVSLFDLSTDLTRKQTQIDQLTNDVECIKQSIQQINNNLTTFIEHATNVYQKKHSGTTSNYDHREKINSDYVWDDQRFIK